MDGIFKRIANRKLEHATEVQEGIDRLRVIKCKCDTCRYYKSTMNDGTGNGYECKVECPDFYKQRSITRCVDWKLSNRYENYIDYAVKHNLIESREFLMSELLK